MRGLHYCGFATLFLQLRRPKVHLIKSLIHAFWPRFFPGPPKASAVFVLSYMKWRWPVRPLHQGAMRDETATSTLIVWGQTIATDANVTAPAFDNAVNNNSCPTKGAHYVTNMRLFPAIIALVRRLHFLSPFSASCTTSFSRRVISRRLNTIKRPSNSTAPTMRPPSGGITARSSSENCGVCPRTGGLEILWFSLCLVF